MTLMNQHVSRQTAIVELGDVNRRSVQMVDNRPIIRAISCSGRVIPAVSLFYDTQGI